MSALTGFAMTLSLIVAIGAQNAFVLRQGLRREHVVPIVLVCALSDALLIAGGIAGLGALISGHPTALTITRYAGAAFLFGYALFAARRAIRPSALAPADQAPTTLTRALLTCLAFTYLNPHVYLDTVVLLGALANQQGETGRWYYGLGSVAASFAWFFSLGFLARRLGPLFAKPRAWQLLDTAIALIMTTLAVTLLTS
ncbi:LysE/ArgO family amino acid transporter [Kribbella deserti]|uniref:LysE/ArgO family amino acid transporter n=1 Tax=Kribbella deserti TaxID=1926257 RepID=A0ABV6QJN2_9ACTN